MSRRASDARHAVLALVAVLACRRGCIGSDLESIKRDHPSIMNQERLKSIVQGAQATQPTKSVKDRDVSWTSASIASSPSSVRSSVWGSASPRCELRRDPRVAGAVPPNPPSPPSPPSASPPVCSSANDCSISEARAARSAAVGNISEIMGDRIWRALWMLDR
mmetsp:Transcript_1225/g.3424  ORF Transcript_1225/g.3424 Transcript_1225/m.3424 type:complete len:163 (-) Transcript_1225:665-1153(-)